MDRDCFSRVRLFLQIPCASLCLFAIANLPNSSASALSVDRNVELHLDDGLPTPYLTQATSDGGLFMPIGRVGTPTIIRIDRKGNIVWRHDVVREQDSFGDAVTVIPQNDGGAIVCADRHQMNDVPGPNRLPGFVMKLDAMGNETSRYDLRSSRQADLPFTDVIMCAKWGNDFLLLAKYYPDRIPAPYEYKSSPVRQMIAVRMHPDLSVVWIKPVPIDDTRVGPLPQAVDSGSDGNLFISTLKNSVLLNSSGDVLHLDVHEMCVLISPLHQASTIRLVCKESSHNWTPWKVVEIGADNEFRRLFYLPNSTGDFGVGAASELPGGGFAIGLVSKKTVIWAFDAKGRHVGSQVLPVKPEILRSSVDVVGMMPTEKGVIVTSTRIKDYNVDSSYGIDVTWISK